MENKINLDLTLKEFRIIYDALIQYDSFIVNYMHDDDILTFKHMYEMIHKDNLKVKKLLQNCYEERGNKNDKK